MEKIIHNYETVMVIDAALTEEEIKATIAKFTDLISANGTLESVDEWGKRRLAYPIDYKTEGCYVLINFSSGVEFPAELERIYNITSGILRSLVVKKA